MFIQITLGAGS